MTRIGDRFVVELRLHATAGYAWELTKPPSTARLDDARLRPAGAALGSLAVQEFEFVATDPGEDTLVLSCKRPWETTVIKQLQMKVVTEP